MSSCQTKSKQKIFTFKENRSTLRLINIDEVLSITIKVDGCKITKGIRCDFLHIAKETEMYIELKGCDIEHAMNQIESSIKILSCNIQKQRKISYIICTRSPLASTEIQKYQRKFKKLYNSELRVKSTPSEESY